MKIVCAVLSVLLIVALGYIFIQHQRAFEGIALIDVDRIVTESVPGKAGREHLSVIDQHFQQGLDKLAKNYENAPEAERTRVLRNAEDALVKQFSLEEQNAGDALKKIIFEETEKWRQRHNVGVIFPLQVALTSDGQRLDCTDEVMAAVNQRHITFADYPELTINKPASDPAPAR